MVKEEAETEAMVVIDRESRRLMEYHRALSTIGRVVLGYKGRKLARERRREEKLDEVRVANNCCIPLVIVTLLEQTSTGGYCR